MNFNLKFIELPLRSRTKFCDGPPARSGAFHENVRWTFESEQIWGWRPLKSRERFMRMSGGHSKVSRGATATGV